jgi:hypothetical protein
MIFVVFVNSPKPHLARRMVQKDAGAPWMMMGQMRSAERVPEEVEDLAADSAEGQIHGEPATAAEDLQMLAGE